MSIPENQRGAATIYVVLISTFVLSGLLVMAVDLGRLYLIQGELQTAADAAAMAAAAQLVGTANAQTHAIEQMAAALDSTDGNDNRFNLHMNQIGNSGTNTSLSTTSVFDFFSTRLDALANANGSQNGAIAKYARIQLSAQTPTMFTRLINPAFGPTGPDVSVAAVAGISSPVCTACGIDDLAVTAPVSTDEVDYGFIPGNFYTLYLTTTQQTSPGCTATTPAALAGTTPPVVQYSILNHVPNGPQADPDGTLFELGAAGMAGSPPAGSATPGSTTIGLTETALTNTYTSCPGQDLICGLNVRFGVDPSTNVCGANAGGEFVTLSPLFSADTDLGAGTYSAGAGLQDFASEYDGSLRRVLTVAVVDSSASLTVLNFRQFLIEEAPGVAQGLNPTASRVTGAFRAQYIGEPVPIRCGGFGGSCSVSIGVGRVVLH